MGKTQEKKITKSKYFVYKKITKKNNLFLNKQFV